MMIPTISVNLPQMPSCHPYWTEADTEAQRAEGTWGRF